MDEEILTDRIDFAASRVFSMKIALHYAMWRIACDVWRTWTNDVSSDAAIRAFIARHPHMSFRVHIRKNTAKLKAEDSANLKSYTEVLKIVERRTLDIFIDLFWFWNVYETGLFTDFKKKVLGPSDSHDSGFLSNHIGFGEGRHFTAIISVFASDLKSTPFFIHEGKNVIISWFVSLHLEW